MNRQKNAGAFAIVVLACAAGLSIGWMIGSRDSLDPLQVSPVKPVKPIFYGDTEHPLIYQDADGWYWTDDLPLEKWTACLNCHAGRWNQGSCRTTLITRLEWWDRDKPPSEYELFPENPQKGTE